jgi:alanyl-tRNA synthetase
MTERVYYRDPYALTFVAQVIERLQWDGVPAVVLDRTAFYPTGGGQPHDTGRLNNVPVLDVAEREADGAIVHVIAEPFSSDEVQGRVDWERRFDFMQQHTGQHILSAAFVEWAEANTVGFHLSGEYATLDLDRAPLSAKDLAGVEVLANAIVFGNRQVVARFVPDEEVPDLPLRKPLAHEGPVRVVEIQRATGPSEVSSLFDCSACGGTHVQAAGEVGLIKITRSERRGTETRVEFLCGGRALTDYQAKNATVMDLAQEFTVGYWELADAIHRLSGDLKETRRELRRSHDALLDAEASALWHQAQPLGGGRIVQVQFEGRGLDDLKHLAQRLIAHPLTVALLATRAQGGEKSYFTFARSDDVDANMGTLVRQACETIGGRGGGRPNFAQGGGPQSDMVGLALASAVETLTASLS